MRCQLLLVLGLVSFVAPALASDRTDAVAAHCRVVLQLDAEAKASPEALEVLQERGGAVEALEQRWQDGVAAAELHLLGTSDDRAFLAARAAWRFLSESRGGQGQPDAMRERAFLLYDLACAAYASTVDWTATEGRSAGVRVRFERAGFLAEPISAFVPACVQDATAFGARAERRGAGGSGFIVMPHTAEREARWPYLPRVDFTYGATAILRFDDAAPRLVLLDPLVVESIDLFGGPQPLESDFTAPIAALAEQVDFDALGKQGVRTPRVELESLFILEPPRSEKIPVLFVHGLQSSAQAFQELLLALRADEQIRRHFQFVVYQYPTGYPLLLLNARLRQEIARLWAWFDAQAPNPRGHRYIAVGHSMGGLQARSLAASSGRTLWDLSFDRDPENVDLSGPAGDVLRRMLLFEPDPSLDRIVFLATPHQGSGWARGALGAMGNTMIEEDPLLRDLRETILDRYGDQLRPDFHALLGAPRTGVDGLAPGAPYLEGLNALPIRAGLPYHSIIGNLFGASESPVGDGVVTYASAHLEGATSELVVKSGHDVQRSPEAIAELRRILLLHLEAE